MKSRSKSFIKSEPTSLLLLWGPAGSLGFPYLQSFDDLVESGAIAAIDKVCAACLSAGVAVGVSTGDAPTAMDIMSAARPAGSADSPPLSSALRAEFRGVAERRGRPGLLAEAMVDPRIEPSLHIRKNGRVRGQVGLLR